MRRGEAPYGKMKGRSSGAPALCFLAWHVRKSRHAVDLRALGTAQNPALRVKEVGRMRRLVVLLLLALLCLALRASSRM